MTRNKIFSIVLIVTMLAPIPVFRTLAAASTSSLGAGTIQSITIDTNPTTMITTALVTLLDAAGLAQTVRISLETGLTMELVAPNEALIGKNILIEDPLDPTKNVTGSVKSLVLVTDPLTKITSLTVTLVNASNIDQVVSLDLTKALLLNLISTNTTKIGTSIVIDPLLILESTTYSKTVSNLGSYFGASLGVTFDQLAAYRKAGFGYGVITQACWMATQLKGDAVLLDQILAAKKTGAFSTIVLPDGKTAANWGQLRKLTLTDAHQNLGSIMSGKATPLPTQIATATAIPAIPPSHQRNGNDNGNGNSNGNGNGNNNGNGNGHSHGGNK